MACCLTLLVSFECDGSQASREKIAEEQRVMSDLRLTHDQISFIDNNIPKTIAWQTYWTWPDANTHAFYLANAGRKVFAKYTSFEHAVIVWVSELRAASLSYIKMPDGHLDYPNSV